MKRLHVHISAEDLAASIDFYASVFGQPPTVEKPGYAKWKLDDPAVNFAVSAQKGDSRGVSHLGIQFDDKEGLTEFKLRMNRADQAFTVQDNAKCCYARSDKAWARDPNGIPWEAFQTHELLDEPGESQFIAAPSRAKSEAGICCA